MKKIFITNKNLVTHMRDFSSQNALLLTVSRISTQMFHMLTNYYCQFIKNMIEVQSKS